MQSVMLIIGALPILPCSRHRLAPAVKLGEAPVFPTYARRQGESGADLEPVAGTSGHRNAGPLGQSRCNADR